MIQTRNYGMRIIQFNYNSCTQFKLIPSESFFLVQNELSLDLGEMLDRLHLFVQISLQEQSVFIFKVYFICHDV